VRFAYPGYDNAHTPEINMGSSFRWNDVDGFDGVMAWVPAFAGMTRRPRHP